MTQDAGNPKSPISTRFEELKFPASVSSVDSGISSGEDVGAPKSPCRLMLLSPDRPSSTDTHNSDSEVNNNNVSNSNEDEEKAGSSGKRSGKKMLPCDYCGKCFDRPSLLNRHLRTHTGERPHVCNICGKGFSTSSSLNTHRRIHSGEKPHQCGVCGKRFTASSNLYYHKMTHVKVSFSKITT